jgi:hypothetical protein
LDSDGVPPSKFAITPEQAKERLAEVEKDVRLSYPSADVRINAPLAMIQLSLGTERGVLMWLLGME